MKSVDLMSLWSFVCSVLLCFSVRNRTHPRYEMRRMWLAGEYFLSQSTQSSLSIFALSFERTERLWHTEFTEAFQLRLAVTFCEIGWLNVSVKLCVFCFSVFFCEKKNAPTVWYNTQTTRWGGLSLTERTEFTEHFCAQFRAHRRPPAYRFHRAFQLKMAVRFCVIGWLNVSVKVCVFCSSVFFCEKKNIGNVWGEVILSQSTQSSLSIFAHSFEPTECLRHTEFTEAFQLTLAVTLCEIGWLNVSVKVCVFCSSVLSVRKRTLETCRGEVYLSQSTQSSLSIFAHSFERTERLRHTEFTEPFSYYHY